MYFALFLLSCHGASCRHNEIAGSLGDTLGERAPQLSPIRYYIWNIFAQITIVSLIANSLRICQLFAYLTEIIWASSANCVNSICIYWANNIGWTEVKIIQFSPQSSLLDTANARVVWDWDWVWVLPRDSQKTQLQTLENVWIVGQVIAEKRV